MKIVFMGTPDFAVPCLERLISDGHEVAAVFTREDKPVGRKQILTAPPVKVTAVQNNIDVYQPKTLKNSPETTKLLRDINPDAIVVVAYGRILPKEILEIAKYGAINVHGSLLPRHRGASPIQWSIVCGDTKTGVTTMLMDEGIDTGDMLLTEELDITDEDTGEILHDKLSLLGAELLSKTIFALEKNEVIPKKQNENDATYAPILTKEMGKLDFSKTAKELSCLIRGFNSWPLTYFYHNNRRFKVWSAKVVDLKGYSVGEFVVKDSNAYIVCGNDTALMLLEICPDGSKKMDAKAFINGRFIENGAILS